MAKENDVLLPALPASESTDLPALLAQMHHRTEQAAQADPASAVSAAHVTSSPKADPPRT